jgi:2-polyprenyl-6-methoxyphenol hydroxylase-like FAD-dependent oxidoreductase
MPTGPALVVGGGVAAATVAFRLARTGRPVTLHAAGPRGASPAPRLVLNAATASLIADVFCAGAGLFDDAHPFDARIVVRNDGTAPEVARASGVVVAGDTLSRSLIRVLVARAAGRVTVTCDEQCVTQRGSFELVVDARGRASELNDGLIKQQRTRHQMGKRRAVCAEVTLRRGAPSNACVFETTDAAWAFLAPTGTRTATFQAMTLDATNDALDAVLRSAVMIPRWVETVRDIPVSFDAAPAVTLPFAGPGWLAVGDAAIAFDPICGDGTGNAVRGAILAAAVVDAVASGEHERASLNYYRWRLDRTFLAHLVACERVYRSFPSPDWAAEVDRGLITPSVLLEGKPGPHAGRFRLDGFRLVPRHEIGRPATPNAW